MKVKHPMGGRKIPLSIGPLTTVEIQGVREGALKRLSQCKVDDEHESMDQTADDVLQARECGGE